MQFLAYVEINNLMPESVKMMMLLIQATCSEENTTVLQFQIENSKEIKPKKKFKQ